MLWLFLLTRFSKKNIILAGLWFSDSKPTMTTFLEPVIQEINNLSSKGSNDSFYMITKIT